MINNKIVYKLNQMAVVLICMWIAIPFFRVRVGVLFLIFVFLVWLLTTELKWLTRKLYLDLLFVFAFFASFIPYIVSGTLRYGSASPNVILINFPLFFIGLFINHYYMFYKKDYKMLGKIAFYFLLFFTIGSIQTYMGLLEYPMASRELATGHVESADLYNRLGIGGFGYIYSATFLLIAILYTLLRKNNLFTVVRYRILILPISIVIVLMLVKASYATSLLITVFGFLIILFVRNKITLITTLLAGVISFLFISRSLLGEFFLFMANLFSTNPILRGKFIDVAQSFFYSSLDGQTGTRFDLYVSSLKAFLSYPLFGIYGPFGSLNNQLIGGHSGWLDLLGYYGLFTGIPLFFTIYYNFRKNLKFYKKTNFYFYIAILYFLILVFGVINPILYVYEIGFVLFCIIPAIPFLPYAFKTSEITETNKEKSDQTNESFMARQYTSSGGMSTNG